MAESYNPFLHRDISHRTNDLESLAHILKGAVGAGVLALPKGFSFAGIWLSVILLIPVAIIVTYGCHLVVKCAHAMEFKNKVPMLSYAETAFLAFKSGPPNLQKYANAARIVIDSFIIFNNYGVAVAYAVYAASNIKQVYDFEKNRDLSDPQLETNLKRLYLAMLVVPMLILCGLITNLKYLAPFSIVADILILSSVGICFHFIFKEPLPPLSNIPAITDNVLLMPNYFSTTVFALEMINILMSVENSTKHPEHFTGLISVLSIAMFIITTIYMAIGFFGYWKWGDDVGDVIVFNLPSGWVAHTIRLMLSAALYFSYILQFITATDLSLGYLRPKFKNNVKLGETIFRIIMGLILFSVAIAVPNVGIYIHLVGALILSFMGIIFPAILDTIILMDSNFGKGKWKLWRNLFIFVFGLLCAVLGTIVSIIEFINYLKE